MENPHATQEKLNDFYYDRLSPCSRMELLTHLSRCEACAGQMAARFPESQLLTAPADTKRKIYRKAAALTKAPAVPSHTLFRYRFRVCGAVFGALVLLFLTSFLKFPLSESVPADYDAYMARQEKSLSREIEQWQKRSERLSREGWLNQTMNSFTGRLNGALDRLLPGENDQTEHHAQ